MVNPEEREQCAADLTIVYTPLHGTGRMPVMRALTEAGFTSLHLVPSQAEPDGDFPTAPYPNPEDPKVFAPAITLGEQVQADILIATDPDADRLGVMVRTEKGYQPLNGNMMGILLAQYLLESRKQHNRLPEDSFVVTSVVSTTMIDAIAAAYHVEVRRVLTGFKYIGQQILQAEKTGRGTYVMGFEESYGYLCGTYARDKDAVGSVLAVAEMAAVYKKKGLSLLDALQNLYQQYGFYQEDVVSLTFEGVEGQQTIQTIMSELRANPKPSYGGLRVLGITDYAEGVDGLPASNVLRVLLEGNSWFCARPSGTEPKLKYYFGSTGATKEEALERLAQVKADVITKR
jgi:phosphoglucomutase